jgi:D-lyxose ketol-isomerase
MRHDDDRFPRRSFLSGVVTAGAFAAAAPVSAAPEKKAMTAIRNEDFYKDGKFLADKAKETYFAMMRKFGYPIPPRLVKEMWTVDFSLGDFARVGMAGIFWYNDKSTNVFGHEIFLLPGQMIVEHGHESTQEAQAKREAWHVRHGWICTFGEGAAPAGVCPVEIPRSQTRHITAHNWKQVKEGEVDALGRSTARHFMIAGANGAIVTEYGTYHDGNGLRFTNTAVKF